ncbi:MAG: 3'-5' exonuclease, partial [Myxococcales bacterium]
ESPAPVQPSAENDERPESLRMEQTPLEAFLEQISLVGDADGGGTTGRVSLMTLHAAKGLEFDAVFLTGLEEGVFPHSRALADGADLEEIEEERRLAYVGITRARRRLFFSLARSRALFGELKFNAPSRFLSDVPRELFGFGNAAPKAAPEPVKPQLRPRGETYVELDEQAGGLDEGDGFEPDEFDQRPHFERRRPPPPPVRKLQAASVQSMVGMRVSHQTFGEGLVIGMGGGAGPTATLIVRFPGLGEKKIVARFLTPIG